jgi:hypothetical protein
MASCHDLDGFAKKTIEANARWLLEERAELPSPIEELYYRDPEAKRDLLSKK